MYDSLKATIQTVRPELFQNETTGTPIPLVSPDDYFDGIYYKLYIVIVIYLLFQKLKEFLVLVN